MLSLEYPASDETAPPPFFAMAGVSDPSPFANHRGGEPVSLKGRTILVVEDESLVALLIQDAIESAGGTLVGPSYTLAEAVAAVRNETCDAAVLDVDLSGEDVFPVADELRRRGIPFAFHTAHAERNEIKARFGDVPLCRKPVRMEDLVSVLARVAGAGSAN